MNDINAYIFGGPEDEETANQLDEKAAEFELYEDMSVTEETATDFYEEQQRLSDRADW